MSRRTLGRDRLGLGVLISKMLRVAKTEKTATITIAALVDRLTDPAKVTDIFSKPDFGTGGVERT